jgi:acyl-coenzyme A synthetase/AMP-(fatty) acid ligase
VSYQTICEHAADHPDKAAIVYNDFAVSYAALAQAIGGTVHYLRSHRLPAGGVVVVRIGTLLDCWIVALALQALGLRTVSVSSVAMIPRLRLGDVAAIVTTESEAHASPVQLDDRERAVVIAIPSADYSMAESVTEPVSAEERDRGGHILYTSGTTGTYKKVFLDAARQARRNAERVQLLCQQQDDIIYYCGDFGLWTAFGYKTPMTVWHMGGCVIFEQRPGWQRQFLHSTKTNAFLMPDRASELIDYLQKHPDRGPLPDFHLVVAGGFISGKLADQLRNQVSSDLENRYGSSELNAAPLRSMVTGHDDLHWLRPTDLRVVEIVDEQGSPCPVDVEGELRVRLTDLDSHAYLDDPQATEKVFRDGCFYPGDMAVRRADGRIRILGRSADVLNVGGQKLAVAPFEQDIQRRLGVGAVCVFSGLNGDDESELLIAIESGTWPEQSELENLVRNFVQFGRARVVRLDRFPRTSTGMSKIDRVALRKALFAA